LARLFSRVRADPLFVQDPIFPISEGSGVPHLASVLPQSDSQDSDGNGLHSFFVGFFSLIIFLSPSSRALVSLHAVIPKS